MEDCCWAGSRGLCKCKKQRYREVCVHQTTWPSSPLSSFLCRLRAQPTRSRALPREGVPQEWYSAAELTTQPVLLQGLPSVKRGITISEPQWWQRYSSLPQGSQCGNGKWPASCLPKIQVSVNGNSRTEERWARDGINSTTPVQMWKAKEKPTLRAPLKISGLSPLGNGGETRKTGDYRGGKQLRVKMPGSVWNLPA